MISDSSHWGGGEVSFFLKFLGPWRVNFSKFLALSGLNILNFLYEIVYCVLFLMPNVVLIFLFLADDESNHVL